MSCEGGEDDLIYKGMAAGTLYLHSGGSPEIECIKYEKLETYQYTKDDNRNVMYFAEMKTSAGPLGHTNNYELGCALCKSNLNKNKNISQNRKLSKRIQT